MNTGQNVWPWLSLSPKVNGVYRLGPSSPASSLYAAVRASERRLLSDDQVRELPSARDLWNAREWAIRARSMVRLKNVLKSQGTGLQVLEVGCGNGWLSGNLQRDGHHVLGLDPFTEEVEQAARVFPQGPAFALGDLLSTTIPVAVFDSVLFPASIQYFKDPVAAITKARMHLKPGGTIHVLDSVIYASEREAHQANMRSSIYFSGIGVPKMASHYYGHCLDAFRDLGALHILERPSARWHWRSMLGRSNGPFTHLIIGPA